MSIKNKPGRLHYSIIAIYKSNLQVFIEEILLSVSLLGVEFGLKNCWEIRFRGETLTWIGNKI
jgi:hypothetical protein